MLKKFLLYHNIHKSWSLDRIFCRIFWVFRTQVLKEFDVSFTENDCSLQIFFSSEASIRELVSQQIQQAADRIWPSLTGPEQEELSREQQQHTQLLKNTLNSARSRRAQLEQDVEIWRDYCQTLDKVRSVLARTQFSDEPVTSLAGLHFNIQKITHALNDVHVSHFSLFYK